MESRRMRKILGTLAAVLAVCALAGFVIAGPGEGTRTYDGTVDSALTASAELEVSDDGAILAAERLPEPRPGEAYQVWLMPKGSDTAQPSVLFLPRDGSASVAVPGAEEAEAVLVTREPKSGSTEPSEQPVVTIELSAYASAGRERDETGLDYAVGRGALAGISGDGIDQDDLVGRGAIGISGDGIDQDEMIGGGGAALAGRPFEYDALGRLTTSVGPAGATFDYDRYGNRFLGPAHSAPDDAGSEPVLARGVPLADPAGGPNFLPLDEDARYYTKIDNTGDGREDVAYRWDLTQVDLTADEPGAEPGEPDKYYPSA
jgi:Anti-sigma-K factor rskA/Domain of unknown function (DUF4331)